MKKNELISAFYALEGLTNGPYGGGPGSRSTRLIAPLMPTLDFSNYARLVKLGIMVRKLLGEKNTSRTIGNLFLLTGPATRINEENEDNVYNQNLRISNFSNRSASMILSADPFLTTAWRTLTSKIAQKNSSNSSKKDSPKIAIRFGLNEVGSHNIRLKSRRT